LDLKTVNLVDGLVIRLKETGTLEITGTLEKSGPDLLLHNQNMEALRVELQQITEMIQYRRYTVKLVIGVGGIMVIRVTPIEELILACTLLQVSGVVIMVVGKSIEMIREHGVLRHIQIGGVMDVPD
jgi:hypothetical protein